MCVRTCVRACTTCSIRTMSARNPMDRTVPSELLASFLPLIVATTPVVANPSSMRSTPNDFNRSATNPDVRTSSYLHI